MALVQVIREPKLARLAVRECGERSPVLAEVELHVFRGATLYVLLDSRGAPVSYNVTRFGKRKKNAWEPYANWYTAYTIEQERRKGHASYLARLVKERAIDAGCVRLKALAGTTGGLMLHAALGDELWGITANVEVAVDTPLVPNAAYDNRTPPNAATDETAPWSLERVLRELNSRSLRYETKKP